MLKRRIIPIELLDSGRLVKTINFSSPRDVGDPVKSSKVYSDQDADELILLNICRRDRSTLPLIDAVRRISEQCFVPLTTGGGITSVEHAASLFEAGADKVLVNSAAYAAPQLISEIAGLYGRQALVVGIDVRVEYDQFVLYANCGTVCESISLNDHVTAIINAGAGEIMIQAIYKDGTMAGYDLELVKAIVSISTIPVIAAGGAGNFVHLKQVFDAGADAAACGSLFNFGDNNPLRAKAFLKNYGIPLKRI